MTVTWRLLLAALLFALPGAAQSTNDLDPASRLLSTQPAPIAVPAASINGVIGSGSGGSCEATGNSAVRIFRDAIPSSCAAPKAFPGTFGTGPYYFDTYQLINATGSTQCVTMSIVAPVQAHLMVYNGSFDPNAFGTNYLADSGSSSVSGAQQGLTVSVASGQTVVVVVQDPTASRTGNTYTLGYDFLTPGCGPAFNLYFEDDQLRSRVWLNSTSGAWSMDVLAGPLTGNYTGTATLTIINGTIVLPLPTAPGQVLYGFYAPAIRRATFTLRTVGGGYQAFLQDTNTTGQLPVVKPQ
jgi:hypothetical protein